MPLVLLVLPWSIASGVRNGCNAAEGQPSCQAPLAYEVTHPTPWWAFNHVFGPILLILLIALPVLATVYLEIRFARSTRRARR